jgi:hypothetical protein
MIDRKNTEIVDEEKFYGERLSTDIGSGSAYVSSKQKTFHRFKLLELMDSSEVKEHFMFIHPYYGDNKFQRLFFSDDLHYMIERQEQNVFYYKRVDSFSNFIDS